MSETPEKRYTRAEADRFFAVAYHGQTWELLDKAERSPEETERMIHCAHASLRHWLDAGGAVNAQRGEWLLARVYTVTGMAERALHHARRCLALTQQHAAEMADFDPAFAHEAAARALALSGDHSAALEHRQRAQTAGQAIQDAEDRALFEADLAGGSWYGLETTQDGDPH